MPACGWQNKAPMTCGKHNFDSKPSRCASNPLQPWRRERTTEGHTMHKSNDTNRQRFASVWDAIEDTPEEAARMRALPKSKMEAEAVANKSDDSGNPTTEVTLWLDVQVVDKFQAFGNDWQARINVVLRAKKACYRLDSRLSLIYLGWLMGSHQPYPKPSIHAGSKRVVTQPCVTGSVTS